jgi:hypothetical protein
MVCTSVQGPDAYNYSNSEEKLYWGHPVCQLGKGKYSKSANKSKNLNGGRFAGICIKI